MRHHTLPLAALAATCLACFSASGQALSYSWIEPDTYGRIGNTAGPDELRGPGGSTTDNTVANNEDGWDEFFVQGSQRFFYVGESSSLSYTDGNAASLETAGGSFSFDDNNNPSGGTGNIYSYWVPTDGNFGSEFWFSMLYRPEDTNGMSLSFRRGSNNLIVDLNVGSAPTTDGTSWGTSTTFVEDQTYFLTAQFLDNGASPETLQIWVDSDLGGSAPANETITSGAIDFTSGNLNNFLSQVRTVASLDPSGGDRGTIDELRYGDSFDAVTPIPEPSVASLFIGLFALGALMLRRRR